MPGGHSTLNTVVLGEGVSRYQIHPYFGHQIASVRLNLPPRARRSNNQAFYVNLAVHMPPPGA
jgi:hypothetical protein